MSRSRFCAARLGWSAGAGSNLFLCVSAASLCCQVAETLPAEVLTKMHAPPKDANVPVITDPTELEAYDGIIFGTGTRFGMIPAQLKAFFDSTGGVWQKGGYIGKTAGLFFSTGTQGGGQETTALTFVTQLTHHGMIFVPLVSGPSPLSENALRRPRLCRRALTSAVWCLCVVCL